MASPNRMQELQFGLQNLPTYNGTKKHLNTFLSQVDRYLTYINAFNPALTDYEKGSILSGIVSKIVGPARESLEDTDITAWEHIRNTLKGQYEIHKNYVTLFNDIIYLNRKDPYELFETILQIQKNLNNQLNSEFEGNSENVKIALEKIIIQNFINKINEPLSSNLANRHPHTLMEVGNLLQNDYQFMKFKQNRFTPQHTTNNPNKPRPNLSVNNPSRTLPHIPPMRFPGQSFPSAPVNTNQNQTRQNFAPRQNIINGQRIKPQPMSIQSRNSFRPQSSQQHSFPYQNRQFNNYLVEDVYTENDYQDVNNEHFCETEYMPYPPEIEDTNSGNSFLEIPPTIEEKS